MKKSISLVLAALLFVVLGCSLDRLTKKDDDAPPTPVTDSKDTDSKDTSSTDKDSSDSSSTADLSIDKFDKIELDMSYDEVKDIMGSEGTETASSKSGSYESKSYEWKGDNYSRVSVRFQNGKLLSKSQSNLSGRSGDADIDQAKFNKVETGMSYDEVKGILGEGEMTRISKIGKATLMSYAWKGDGYARIYASFKDDKLTNKTQSGLK